ncbi:MAG: hypothetical protein O3C49_08080 [Proteobacteria bacterium]|nr:hypothetical protein [Pseudomonadota bacterium]
MQDAHSDHGTVVKPNEAALIVDADGNIKMCMPEYSDEEEVPFFVMVLTAVWLKMRDNEQWGLELAEEVFSDDE